VEKFIPPRKGRSHVLRVIREVLFLNRRRNDLNATGIPDARHAHRAVAVIISDFIGSPAVSVRERSRNLRPQMMLLESLAQSAFSMLRRQWRHDLVAVQITDRHELELPALGRLVLKDAETGEVVEIHTGDTRKRAAFAERKPAQNDGSAVPLGRD
jgi:uncharacterized protein (DUF58 family)